MKKNGEHTGNYGEQNFYLVIISGFRFHVNFAFVENLTEQTANYTHVLLLWWIFHLKAIIGVSDSATFFSRYLSPQVTFSSQHICSCCCARFKQIQSQSYYAIISFFRQWQSAADILQF